MNEDNNSLFPRQQSLGHSALWIASVALVYFIVARLSFSLVFQPENIAAIWPPVGIFLSALLLTRPALRPWLAGSIFLTDIAVEMLGGSPMHIAALYAVAVLGDGVISCWLLLRFVGAPITFRSVRQVAGWLIFSVIISNALVSLLAAATSLLQPGSHTILSSWQWWAASDAVGNLLVTPLLLSLAALPRARRRPQILARAAEAAALFISLALLNWFLIRQLAEHKLFALFLPYVTFPFLLWAAWRFEVLGVAVSGLIIAAIAIPFTAMGAVPAFSFAPGVLDDVIVVQLLLAVTSIPPLFLAASVAERRQAREDAQRAAELHRTTLMSVGDAVISTNCHGLVDLMNPVAQTLTGWSIGEARGKRLAEVFRIINEDTRQTVESPVDRVLRDGLVVGLSNHTLLVAKDGTERPIADSGAPIRNEQNDIVGVVLVFRDQTAERATNKALRESEQLLHESQGIAGLGSYTLDVASGLWRSSPSLDKLLGIEESFSRTVEGWLELIHPDDRAMMTDYFKNEVLGQGRHFKKEYRIIRRNDRSERWVHGLGKLEFDSHGRILRMIGTIQDITERKRAEAAISDRGRFVESLVNMAPDILYIYDLVQKKNIFSNTALQKILGYSTDEIQSMGSQLIPLLMHPDDLRTYLQGAIPQYATAKDGEAIIHEYRMRHKSGDWRWLASNETIYQRRPDGSPRQVFGLVHDVTESKRLEEELRASQRKFRNIVEASPMGMHLYEVTGDGALVFAGANPSADRILGVDHTQFIGKSIEEAFPGLIHTEVPARYKETAVHGTPWRTEQIDYAEGVIRGAFEVAAFQTEPGKMVALFNAITERKRNEQEVARLLQEWQMTFDAVGDAIWLLDKDQLVLRANRAASQLFRCPGAGGDRQHCWEILHGTTAPIENCPVVRSSRSLRREFMELKIGERWYQITADPVLDASNQYAGAVHIVRNITERVHIDDALRERDDQLAKILATAPGLVCSFRRRPDGSTSFPFGGDRVDEFYGFTPGTMALDASPMFRLVHPDDAGRMSETTTESVRTMSAWRCEWRYNHPVRGEIWLEGHSMPVREPDGSILWHGVITDITDRKRADAAQDALQAELTQAQKMESVGRLAGGVAHDFNNLLMGIMGYTELCMDQIGPDHPIHGWLGEIANGATRSAQLTRQLLAFARKQTIAPIVMDMNDAIESILKLLRRTLGEDVAIQWQPGHGIWPLKMDPSQVDQILLNLCINARDALPGAGMITIETGNAALDPTYCALHPEAIPGQFVLLRVTDTGSGIDADTLQHIFEPFFTTKAVGAGTGLGLSTVYGIVKQNGGFIEVQTETGKGTTFKIYLPRLPAEDSAQSAASPIEKLPRGRETVLLVEDEQSVRMTTQIFLENLGYTAIVAENAEHALRLAAQHAGEIHLLIADVIMPGMSGSDLSKRLGPLRPAMKTLYISGFTADVIARRGVLDAGVNFLAKPFSRDDLAHKVRKVLEEGPIHSADSSLTPG